MKHIFLNLKRFDVPVCYGGVNRIAPMGEWGGYIVKNTQEALKTYDPAEVEFVQYLPEAHLLSAVAARGEDSPVQVGCQSVYRMNTAPGGNFGAFTTNRPVSAMLAMGVKATIIGHCEERNDKMGILAEAGVVDTKAVNRLLNQEIKLAVENGMTVLYCIGEKRYGAGPVGPGPPGAAGNRPGGSGQDQGGHRLRAHLVHRPGQDPGWPGLHPEDRPVCEGSHRRLRCGLRRRPESGQRGNAGFHPGESTAASSP